MAFKYIWYGHGTHGIETDGHKILIDPFFTGNPAASITADKVEADFVIVSHGHGDHIADAEDIAMDVLWVTTQVSWTQSTKLFNG